MDIVEEYLKIDKGDVTHVTDSCVTYKEESVNKLNSDLNDVESKGKVFIASTTEVRGLGCEGVEEGKVFRKEFGLKGWM